VLHINICIFVKELYTIEKVIFYILNVYHSLDGLPLLLFSHFSLLLQTKGHVLIDLELPFNEEIRLADYSNPQFKCCIILFWC